MAADEQRAKGRATDAKELSDQELGAAAGWRPSSARNSPSFRTNGGYYKVGAGLHIVPGNPYTFACEYWTPENPHKLYDVAETCLICGHFRNPRCEFKIGVGFAGWD